MTLAYRLIGMTYQVTVGPDGTSKHEAMRRTIHRLHGPFLSLYTKAEHVLFVVLSMSRLVPQIQVEDIGRDNLIIPIVPEELSNEVHQFVVNTGAMGEPEGGTWCQIVEEDQLLDFHDSTVISLFGLRVTSVTKE